MAEEDELFEALEMVEERLDDEDIYECNECSVSFSDVNEHLAKYHCNSDGTYTILEDDNESSKDSDENVGIALIKTKEGFFKCSECPFNKIFVSYKRFITHMKTHKTLTGEDFFKDLEDSFSEKDIRNKEMCEEVKTTSGLALFRCKICNAEFDSRKPLLLHVPMHRNSAEALSRSSQIPSQASFVCLLCNKSFEEKYEQEMHMIAHRENNTLELVKKNDKKTTEKTKGSHQCQYCGKEFKRPHEKVKHERVHTNEKPYACDICGKTFRVTYCLSLHKRNVHSDERPYVCTYPGCNKRFKAQGVYNHHLNTHGTEKRFKCTYCSKSFKTSVQLAGHKNTHTKPFSCKICNRTFSSLYSAKNHMATHNRTDDNLKYVCGVCGASYARGFALNDHMKAIHPDNYAGEADQMDVIEEYEIVEEIESSKDSQIYAVVLDSTE